MSLPDIVVAKLDTYLKYHLNIVFDPYDEKTHGGYTLEPQTIMVRGANVSGYVITNWNVSTAQPTIEQLTQYTEKDVFRVSKLLQAFTHNVDLGLIYATKRQELKTLLPPENWANYTNSEKKCLANAFLVTKTQRLEVLSIEEESDASLKYHRKMTVCREHSWSNVLAEIYNNFVDGKAVVALVSGYKNSYIEGLDSFASYLTNEFGNIAYETHTGITVSDVQTKCLNLLV